MPIDCGMAADRDAAANAAIKRGAPFKPRHTHEKPDESVPAQKKCARCGKTECQFWRMKNQPDGLDYYCTVCRNLNTLQWRKSDPKRVEKHRKYGRDYYYAKKAKQGEK